MTEVLKANRVFVEGTKVVDITDINVTANDVVSGITFHLSTGQVVSGNIEEYDGTIE